MDKEKYTLALRFFNDDPNFTLGFESGTFYQRVKSGELISAQSFHAENKEQIELICVQANAKYKIEKLDQYWYSVSIIAYIENN